MDTTSLIRFPVSFGTTRLETSEALREYARDWFSAGFVQMSSDVELFGLLKSIHKKGRIHG